MRFGRTDESAAQCGTSIRRRHGTRLLRLTTVNQRTQGTTAKQRRIQRAIGHVMIVQIQLFQLAQRKIRTGTGT